jgi:hypothetical protein
MILRNLSKASEKENKENGNKKEKWRISVGKK